MFSPQYQHCRLSDAGLATCTRISSVERLPFGSVGGADEESARRAHKRSAEPREPRH